MNEYNFKIGEQILVEYAGNVTYNATVASHPQNGEMKVLWDSKGTDFVACSQCVSLD